MKRKVEKTHIIRDISWLSFNARVLQEANDKGVPISERLRFLGIFSNNLDEFFRVRVASLNRMLQFGKAANVYLENNPKEILKEIQETLQTQQKEFERIYQDICVELKRDKIAIVDESKLTKNQQEFVNNYFNDKVRTHIAPLMIESIPELPNLNDKSIYLACMLSNNENSFMNSYSLIEIPTQYLPRFVILPNNKNEKNIILLENIIKYCLPNLFTQFGFNSFEAYIIKVTRDAELDIDNDINTNLIEKIEKGLKNRKKGKAIRLVYDKAIPKNMLDYLLKLLNLSKKDQLVPGGSIHNFKDFMDFPTEVFEQRLVRKKPFVHPLFTQPVRILDVLNRQDVMLHFPYHSFDSIIDLLREAAIDPFVESIKITCYRLAKESKIVKALINAVRNGKKVTVVIELKARFDEEANLVWKRVLEEEGVKVLVGFPDMKVHAKICSIAKRVNKKLKYYGFVSTGNLNENTARFYGDHCLLTANLKILSDVNRVFNFIEKPVDYSELHKCKYLITSPINTREYFIQKIRNEIKQTNKKHQGSIILKLNSLADDKLIEELYKAAEVGVDIKLVVRGICRVVTTNNKWAQNINAISIVDEYLEHARILFFENKGIDDLYISSADWMVRNIDHRVEVTAPIFNKNIKQELKDILAIQLVENEKARILDNKQQNHYVTRTLNEKWIRSQVEIYNYLQSKKY